MPDRHVNVESTTGHCVAVNGSWSITTKGFSEEKEGNVKAQNTVNSEWVKGENGRPQLKEIPDSEKEWPCDLTLLALGFTGPEKSLAEQLGLEEDTRTNIKAERNYQTNIPNIFAAGDMRRGQSLIVWAISEGREAAHHVDKFLMGKSKLPTKGPGDLPAA